MREECAALAAIYPDDWQSINDTTFSCSVHTNGLGLTLHLALPPEYPDTAPPLAEIRAEGFASEDEIDALYGQLLSIWSQHKGEDILFMWIEALREFVQVKTDSAHDDQEKTEAPTIQSEHSIIDYEELEQYIDVEPPTHHFKGSKQPVDEDAASPEIFTDDPIVDRKSVFQAHLAIVHSKEEVRRAMSKLKENTKIARATHNISAYRIAGATPSSFLSDCDDDGETAAGGRLLHLLNSMEAKNVLVVVSRWYGGIQLGPDRFKHINRCARNIVAKHL